MATPSSQILTLRPDLRAMAQVNLAQMEAGFIHKRLAPVIEVGVAAGNFNIIALEQLMQEHETLRAPGTEYSQASWTFTPSQFGTANYGWKETVDNQEAAKYAAIVDPELYAAARAFYFLHLGQERRMARALFNTDTFNQTNKNATNAQIPWSDWINAKPVDDVEAAMRAVFLRTGLWPNALILTQSAFRNLQRCQQVFEKVASLGAGDRATATDINIDRLKAVLMVDEIIVANSVTNSANQAQTRQLSEIWDADKAMVARLCKTTDMQEPGLVQQFHWGGAGSSFDGTMVSYPKYGIDAMCYQVFNNVGLKIKYSECGQLITGISSSTLSMPTGYDVNGWYTAPAAA